MRRRWLSLIPVVESAILAIAYLPLSQTTPRGTLDGSWQLGMSLVHLRGIPAGPGFVFTYGPLGFLEYPNVVWSPGAILGLVYIVVTTFAFYLLVCKGLLEWMPPIVAFAFTAAFALATTGVFSVAEVATAALILWAAPMLRPAVLREALPLWIPAALGAAAALQMLVKFGPGAMTIALAAIVTVARPPRPRNLVLTFGSFIAGFVVLWLAAGESLGDIGQWLWGSLQLSAGYSASMASHAGLSGGKYWVFWAIVVAAICVGLVRLVLTAHAAALPTVALVALAAWYYTKEGLTRLDQPHVTVVYVGVAALVVAIPWDRRRMSVGIVGLTISLAGVVITAGPGGTPGRVRELVSQPRHRLGEAERIVRAVVQPSFRSSELARARYTIAIAFPFSLPLARDLRNARVHADPWLIATVWAYGLSWTPVPIFQTYSAYTTSLDDLNADSLQDGDGPNAVIRQQHPYRALGRVPAWESPDYMVVLTCDYEITGETSRWQVLRRAASVCGAPRPLSWRVAHGSETVSVPTPTDARDIVVAAFDYTRSPAQQLLTLLLKPFRLPTVVTNGAKTGFVAGTASQMHLVHVPETIGARRITNAGLDIKTLSFPNAPGDVTVRFYEVSTR